ncbi:T9SS type A sorting domain-containing protein [Epilithonimonas pallida]|uniref:Por secretion system C-terminal sorting domain-containing protein n=1 Tax=Epilithonimonas pallida TaxID=373671 RepID=A0ABY1R230_9FLAO|nr:T9SS type A sorting domain-containing protein [Epilithonimonas pallida]SMP92022.1 Por secretion system C-terminal sorting domain-containing protein [Epilithonimonas pallida]
MKNKILIRFLILLIAPTGLLKAQKTIASTGITAIGSGGSSSYTVGQIDYRQKGSNAEVMEGVQHAYEIITLAVEDLNNKERNILLYPNPVKDLLWIEFSDKNYQNSNYTLFDSQGKLIKKGNLNQQKSELDFSLLPSSVYIIRVFQNDQTIKTFKVIKK